MDAKESEMERVSKQQFANLYAKLLDVAQRGDKTFYSEVEGLVGLDHHLSQDRKVMGGLLALISRAEVGQGRPMLSSVVWRKDIDRIGPGFIPLAHELGRIRPGQNECMGNGISRSDLLLISLNGPASTKQAGEV